MRVLFVDDERSAHINFNHIVEKINDIFSVQYLFDYESAIQYAKNNRVDCAFLDISLPGKNGIELAKELCSINPKIELAFITGYEDFTKDAYKVGGRAYISKPYLDEEIDKILDLMQKLVYTPKNNYLNMSDESKVIYAKTFGSFDLLIDGKPVHFKNSKAKELLAFLIDQVGGTVSNTQIFYALWEKQEYTRSTSTYVRRTLRALKDELHELDINDLILSRRNSLCINNALIKCDYYDLINGNVNVAHLYNGEYMNQYSWGETTIPLINRIVGTIDG